jgi:DNA transformation protein
VTRGPRGLGAAGDAGFLAFVLDQLGGSPDVESRAMFGGHGLYRKGTFFAIVSRGRLYFRTNEATRPDYQARGMRPFRPSARQTLTSYYEVPAEVLEEPAEVARWARAAAVAAGRGAAAGRAKNRPGTVRAVLLAVSLLGGAHSARAQVAPAAAIDSAAAQVATPAAIDSVAADPSLLWRFDTGG